MISGKPLNKGDRQVRHLSMPNNKSLRSLTRLLAHTNKIRALARKTPLVQRLPKKIQPEHLVRALLLAVCKATPAFRSLASAIGSLAGQSLSRQAVFQRLNHEGAPTFLRLVLLEVLDNQTRRLPWLRSTLIRSLRDSIPKTIERILIEDSSVLPLHRCLCETLAGSVNQYGESAALRLRWVIDYLTGQTVDAALHHGRENDLSTAFELLDWIRPGDLVRRDMGYFCLECLRQIDKAGIFFLRRVPEGTRIIEQGSEEALKLPRLLGKTHQGSHNWQVRVGSKARLPGRLIALSFDPQRAASKKRALRQTLRKSGKTPSKDQLTLCAWSVVFTNLEQDILDDEVVAGLYRARWMIETAFKGLKTGQDLENWSRHRTNVNTIQCLAYAHAIVAILSLELWRWLGRVPNATGGGKSCGETNAMSPPWSGCLIRPVRVIGLIMAFESIVPLLQTLFKERAGPSSLARELLHIAPYVTAEKRKRKSLDEIILGLLTLR